MKHISKRLVLTFAVLSTGVFARAADEPQPVWLVSTRGLSSCHRLNDAPENIYYWRMNEDCGWTAADSRDFHAGDAAAIPTIVFIHGNQTDADEAVENGWFTYQTIRAATDDRPFRYVIWSWPSDRVFRHIRPDVQRKADASDVESGRLAEWLDDLRPGMKVSLVGHSFGSRIITGALHLLAGGDMAGERLPDATVAAWSGGRRNPVRAVLLAPAMNADWLAPDRRHGLTLSLIDQAIVTRNRCDRALRWYSWLYGRGGAEAMGFLGPCGIGDAENIVVLDLGGTVGKSHEFQDYCSASNLIGQWGRYTFLDDTSPQDADNATQAAH